MTIQLLLVSGALVGFFIGIAIKKPKMGCLVLSVVPVAMIAYISWRQGVNPDQLRSTSALNFVFGPLWPSLGAIGGYLGGTFVRSALDKR